MTRSLTIELSHRARALLARDGRDAIVGGIHLGRDLTLLELYLVVDQQGTLTVEANALLGDVIYMENPNRTPIRTSPNDVLEEAIDVLGRHLVLEDLADV